MTHRADTELVETDHGLRWVTVDGVRIGDRPVSARFAIHVAAWLNTTGALEALVRRPKGIPLPAEARASREKLEAAVVPPREPELKPDPAGAAAALEIVRQLRGRDG